MDKKLSVNLLLFGFILCVICNSCANKKQTRVLIFSKTAGFRHINAISAGINAIRKLGQQHDFMVDTTEDASKFNEETLKNYNAIIFLNVSGNVFDREQQISFQRYIQAGGGFLAIHGPTDAERNWPWYGQLIGAYFNSHPKIQKARYYVTDLKHPAVDSLPKSFFHKDEIYNFQKVSPDIRILIKVDESSFQGGKMGDSHPSVWYHDFQGGRSFYMAMGHSPENYTEQNFLRILYGGIKYAAGGDNPSQLNYSHSVPEDNRFYKHVLMKSLDEPIQMAFDGTKTIFFAERRGNIIAYDQKSGRSMVAGKINVASRYEDGLLGITTDPKFSDNHWIYVFYTEPSANNFHISRFRLNDDNRLDNESEKILIKIPKEVLDGSHTGGGLTFDPRGTGDLYITVGDNSSPRATGYNPIDEREGRMVWDAQRSASNTNDLRGKILRIHPEDNGTYTIPKGNLFPPGTAKTRPEIYTMGHRQPWRVYVDSKTGWLYESEVGPDAKVDSAGRGPRGLDEFNIIRKPGNYGWPYFLGDNKAYMKYDFANGKPGKAFSPDRPENHSRYNTGLAILPPAQKATIWYPYASSEIFPLMGSGGRSATGGPVYHEDEYKKSNTRFPAYYNNKWFISDWIRGWINVVTLDVQGNYKSMEQFMPQEKFNSPLDIQFGPDGSLYMLEYGSGWFQANGDARLVRIEYTGGNRPPVVKATANKTEGSLPFKVNLSAAGTMDYDANDKLFYEWKIASATGEIINTFNRSNAEYIFTNQGVYIATLTVTDDKGGANSKIIELKAGNEPAVIDISVKGNQTFFFPDQKINYTITVSDKEDGTFSGNTIENLFVKVDYLPQGYIKPEENGDATQTKGEGDSFASIGPQLLINGSDCYSCHKLKSKSIGPSFEAIAERYKKDNNAYEKLAVKIINGGAGSWGDVAMSAHPDLKLDEAKIITKYILSNRPDKTLPAAGNFITPLPDPQDINGVYLLYAKYIDKGGNGVSPVIGEKMYVLRNPRLKPGSADHFKNVMLFDVPNSSVQQVLPYGQSAYLAFKHIDLTEIREINFTTGKVASNTVIEVHLDSPTGRLIGQARMQNSNSDKLSAPQTAKVLIDDVRGLHDLYFIFKNPKVKDDKQICSVYAITVSR
jgi:cytochrome c